MRGRWDAKNSPRDYGIEEPYWGPALIVDADTERCGYVASLDICVEITYFSR